jgi:hypothetical protein
VSDAITRRAIAVMDALRQAEQHLAAIEEEHDERLLAASTAAIRAAIELLHTRADPAPDMAGILKAAYPQLHAATRHTEHLLTDYDVLLCMECAQPQLPADLDDTGRCRYCVNGPFTAPSTDGLPDCTWSPTAEIAYGEDLPHLTKLITRLLHRFPLENLALARARKDGDLRLQADMMSLEVRDDLLETGAVLDAVALSCPPGSCLPDPCQEGSPNPRPEPPPRADELRSDAGAIAEALLAYDREHGTNTTPIPDPVHDRDVSREQARAYLRREWRASRSWQPNDDEPPPVQSQQR